jgi:tRNA (guanine37-N1)-methyltransferase
LSRAPATDAAQNIAMRFDCITLFPELFEAHLRTGVTRRAFQADDAADGSLLAPPVDVRLWPLRDFADNTYRRVDDRPFGGGPGMVLLAEPLLRALAAVAADARACGVSAPRPVVHFTPAGQSLNQGLVQAFAAGPGAVLLCGRYEGVDQRVIDRHVTHEISLGDFVLSGGELPALALLDAVARLVPGVMKPASHAQDSFGDGLLEGPCYSRPERLSGGDAGQAEDVPAVLLSGDHAAVARHRRHAALALTARRRPELIAAARAAGRLSAADEAYLRSLELY